MIITYCGELWSGTTCRMRCDALRSLGHELVEIDTTYLPSGVRGFIYRVLKKLGHLIDKSGANEQLLASVCHDDPSVVWVDKGLSIAPRTLRRIRMLRPNIHIVHYSPDDMTGGRHNQSRNYLEDIPLYDLHVTTKSFNVSELYSRGAKDVLLLNNAYSTSVHRPMDVTPKDKAIFGGDVGFIGGFEINRAKSILFLAEHGLTVRVWGGGWKPWLKKHSCPGMVIEARPLWGEEYVKAICSFSINLGFLRKLNRDLQTTRSVEIPACGGFMIAERSEEHAALFKEGVEAEFFSNDEELLEKCRYFLENPADRLRIANAGRERCLRSGYDYEQHVDAVLRVFRVRSE